MTEPTRRPRPWLRLRHADPSARLRAVRDLASTAQIAVAALAVVTGGGLSVATLLVVLGLAAWALLRPLPAVVSTRSQRLWTLGVFVALVATIARALLRAEYLDAGVDFLLLLVVQRLFNRQRAREHMQLLMLGALLMVVGAVINTELSYPPLLLLYIVLAVLALMLNNLVAEGERLGPRVMLALAREGLLRLRSLVRASVGVSAMAAAGAVVTFLLFPRWGVGAFLRGSMATEVRSGFSNEVQLGGFGTIKEDTTVVMRIEPLHPTTVEAEPGWHLRGSAFDTYQDGAWGTGRLGETAETLMGMWGYQTLAPLGRPLVGRAAPNQAVPVAPRLRPGSSGPDALLWARVTLEDIGADVLFVASEPLALKLVPRGPVEARAQLHPGRNREFRVGKLPGPVHYEFISRLNEPTAEALRALGEPPLDGLDRAYTQRSPTLSPEVTALAVALTADAPTRLQKVEAIMAHLAGFRYSLQLVATKRAAAGADPLEGFLFESQTGHCEYFATALAVLLREVGVPTRLVNGYYGAHYNAIGGFYTVRQADAHSWVEVHFGPLGWVTFDPTPAEGRRAGNDAPLWLAASELVDALRNKYLEWVVGFDLSKQLTLLDQAGVRQRGTGSFRTQALVAWLGSGIAIVLVFVRVLRWWRKPRPLAATKVWQRVLAALARRGHVPRPAESPTAFAQRLAHRDAPGADAVAAFAHQYESLRFGPSPTPDALSALLELGTQTCRAVRGARQ